MAKFFKLCSILTLLTILCIFQTHTISSAKSKEKTLNVKGNSALALNYHRIRDDNWFKNTLFTLSNSKEIKNYSISKEAFEAEIKWLKAHGAHFLTEKEFQHYKEKGKFPPKSVWISFDDMEQSVYDNANPIIEKYKIPVTGFIITGQIGNENFHNLNLSDLSTLKILNHSKYWTFSSHTDNLHSLTKDRKAIMTSTPDDKLKDDIVKSNLFIHKQFHKNNDSIAYPYGEVSNQNIKVLKKEGIRYGYTLEDKTVKPSENNYRIPRVLMNEDAFNKLIKKWDGFADGR
ncbi:intercellular adhesin biosynthesis polysaccharide N-deacetylase [Staphylococcus lugdunensis]|uniref:intercellular adhesin biosynthesis polysaccharide N-deacetylase n=1 Tax=Staphylococcus TaxID=1279 RepID=UPI0008A1CB69|nr:MULTISPECIES: intercellular adhesin biosynthesis polysaccharide N-deacetylase [Staphylococcus]ARJ14994.1 intercellular adhesin biosynthesis polysaccharide N-deacetylase [Staphylococcus lugdunensis]MCH8664901.1 intercellular adhesin biosynthesis polysaccharide N-deacetylase [Staphylococcus lugdunensis]OFJ63980.1 intercellular adhesin biosynthesis polysaccharide N-deacetylase [Staphylococcus sp. HMSC077E11]OFM47894.1 intercellular adhesin biosynthesis polysaccharide N-deacetylase [Staphylococc